jgi:hypothetical protein
MAYGIVRTDNMYGTDVRAALVSIKYMGNDGSTPTAIENGSVLKVGALIEGEREIYVGGAVAANDKVEDVVLVASPEVMYDERKKNLDEFINEAGKACRGYRLHSGDIFSVTKDVLAGKETPAVGDVVELAAGTKLNVADSATEGSTTIGSIIDVNVVGRYTYYAIKVN